jgi:sigma-B regulation protein RsbU (phosphoserine phosphatase)
MNDVAAQWRHDCRTPIHQILGYSELLVEEAELEGNGSLVRDLRRIRSAALVLLEQVSGRSGARRTRGSAEASSSPTVARRPGSGDPELAFESSEARGSISGRVLVVDDDRENCELLIRRLEREGLEVEAVMEGVAALRRAAEGGLDLILLDVLMPGMDGREVLMGLKASDQTRHIPVLMVSALDEFNSVVRCIQAGAEDYLPKPVEPALLRARIGACLERKHLRDQDQEHLRRIEETQARLAGELAEAARYVRSILPEPMSGHPTVDWLYRPCSELGGDAFGYHWVDGDRMAIYLLDVCGHGVGASLLSVAAIHVLRSNGLAGVDYGDPAAVLAALNRAFPMESQGDMYFTLWYGVYSAVEQRLRYSSAGHPPALLFGSSSEVGAWTVTRLRTPGLPVGAVPGSAYLTAECQIQSGMRLCVISDGCYEMPTTDGSFVGLEKLSHALSDLSPGEAGLRSFERWLDERSMGGSSDDVSMVRVHFR